MKKIKSDLEIYRTRWNRWLGQVTRCDRDSWVKLLDCNWTCWVNKVLDRDESGYQVRLHASSNQSSVYYLYEEAIAVATMKELMQLDEIYCQEILRGR